MPLYKQDPNDSTKQVPNIQGDNRHDRAKTPTAFTLTKSPNYIVVKEDVAAGLGLYFNPTTFSASAAAEQVGDLGATTYSGSSGYGEFNKLPKGTYNLHPIAVSGSAADVEHITFVYKSSLSTGGF